MQYFQGFNALANHLSTVVPRIIRGNLIAALEQIGDQVAVRSVHKVGHYQQAVGQWPGWQPLAESTLRQKALHGWGMGGNPDTPLYATGRFQGDISHRVNRSHLNVEIGTHADYIVYTELGTVRMPPRPVFGPAADEVLPGMLPMIAQFAGMGIGGMVASSRFRTGGGYVDVTGLTNPGGAPMTPIRPGVY